MKFDKIKKLGIAAGIVAVLGVTGALDRPIYEINEASHSMFYVSAIGSNEDFRMEAINKDFDKKIAEIEKVNPLSADAKQEVALLKSFIQSADYKESLKDINFFDKERYDGIDRALSASLNAKLPYGKFYEKMEEDGWNLAETKLETYEVDSKGNRIQKASFEFSPNLNFDSFGHLRPEGTFGFFNDKKSLENYGKSREMAEPFEPFVIKMPSKEQVKNNIANVQNSSEVKKDTAKRNKIS